MSKKNSRLRNAIPTPTPVLANWMLAVRVLQDLLARLLFGRFVSILADRLVDFGWLN